MKEERERRPWDRFSTIACGFVSSTLAGPPTRDDLYGFALRMPYGQVIKVFKASFPGCQLTGYGFPAEVRRKGISDITIQRSAETVGGRNPCQLEAGSHLTLRFAHPEVDRSGGVISIRVDGALKMGSGEVEAIGSALANLKSQYGEPTKVESSERPAIGPTDAPIPNRISYQMHGQWYDTRCAASKSRQCNDSALWVLASAFSTPGTAIDGLPATHMIIELQATKAEERQRVWYMKNRDRK